MGGWTADRGERLPQQTVPWMINQNVFYGRMGVVLGVVLIPLGLLSTPLLTPGIGSLLCGVLLLWNARSRETR